MDSRGVRVRRALPSEASIVENLFQFYVYDFSEIIGDGPNAIGLNGLGRFDVRHDFSPYWRDAGHFALLIFARESIAGFALINTASQRGGTIERNMAEFFVARRFRRHGVATDAVHQIVAQYPGQWEAAVMASNTAAQAFWPRALSSSSCVANLHSHSGDGVNWSGPIWSFSSQPASVAVTPPTPPPSR